MLTELQALVEVNMTRGLINIQSWVHSKFQCSWYLELWV